MSATTLASTEWNSGHYEPLVVSDHSIQIRLLTIQPSTEDPSIIKVELLTAQLFHDPNIEVKKSISEWKGIEESLEDIPRGTYVCATPFQALSYVWGGADLTSDIYCNGHPRRVTQNLYNALKSLRATHSGSYLWIDALCINQEDLTEKSKQVAVMGSIYAAASGVVVYLGEMNDDRRKAIQWLQRVRDDGPVGEDLPKFTQRSIDRLGLPASQLPDTLMSLLDATWFSRAWVIQEFCLARRVEMYVGTKTVPLLEFLTLAFVAADQGSDSAGLIVQAVLHATSLYMQRRDFPLTLDYHVDVLISKMVLSDCQNPRDKVYALLALMPKSISDAMKPDYRIAPEELYSQFALQVMLHYNNTWVLGLRRRVKRGSTELPPWFPDFRQRLMLPEGLTSLWTATGWKGAGMKDGPVAADLTPFQGAQALKLRLARAAKVRAVCEVMNTDEAFMEEEGPVLPDAELARLSGAWVNFALNATDKLYNVGEITSVDALDTLWRSMVRNQASANKVRKRRPGERHRLAALRALHSVASTCREPPLTLTDFGVKPDDPMPSRPPLWGGNASEERSFTVRAWRKCSMHTLFITDDGDLGIGPENTELGDVVHVVAGGYHPLIVRDRAGDLPGLVGECYVHALMENPRNTEYAFSSVEIR